MPIVIITDDLLGFLPVNSKDYDQIEKGLQDQICVDLTTTEEEEKVCCRTDEEEQVNREKNDVHHYSHLFSRRRPQAGQESPI